jgi:hypothetical protein
MMGALQLSRMALRMLATVMGGFGIFCLHVSFIAPHSGLHAILFLGTATAITLALGEPS